MYAIIDIETTGGNSVTDKITEIAIYLHDGEKVVDEFQTLVNPEKRIPYKITVLTGITDEMVADAPKFYEVAKKVVEMTEGATFVAHNAAFDYNFIRNEFKSLGYEYKKDRICTVKLSRKLMPGHPSYSLGKLCKALNIENSARHRAAGDAFATVKLFEILLGLEKDPYKTQKQKLDLEALGMHSNISHELLDSIPDETGVYYFHDEYGNLIYIGKSVGIRSRILSHINNNTTKRALEMRRRIADISWEVTGSELIALLKESEEIKKLKPFYNRAQRKGGSKYALYADFDMNGYLSLSVERSRKDASPLMVFTSSRESQNFIRILTDKYGLCQKLTGLYKSSGPCFYYSLHQCQGACIGEEEADEYNIRVEEAVRSFTYESENLLIVGKGRSGEEIAVVAIENGKYLGYGFTDQEVSHSRPETALDIIQPCMHNRDVQQIIRSYLRKKKVMEVIKF